MFFCKILLKDNKHSGQGVFKMMEKDIYTVYIYIFLNLLLCLGIPWDLWEIPLFCFYLLCLYRQCRHGLFSFRWRQAGLQSELAHVSTWRSPLSLHSTAHLFSSLWPTSPFSISAKNKATQKKKTAIRLEKKRNVLAALKILERRFIVTPSNYQVFHNFATKVCSE